MSKEEQGKYPFQILGRRLRGMREKLRESLAEVSGAVEIEIDALNSIELGQQKPSEDILLLLISHFGVREEEATSLWELAQYDQQRPHKDNDTIRPSVMVMQGEARIIYTDVVHAVANQYGLVINFMQESGPAGQPLIISRIGMSREHAKSLIDVLKQTLESMESHVPQALPAPDNSKKTNKNKKTDH